MLPVKYVYHSIFYILYTDIYLLNLHLLDEEKNPIQVKELLLYLLIVRVLTNSFC